MKSHRMFSSNIFYRLYCLIKYSVFLKKERDGGSFCIFVFFKRGSYKIFLLLFFTKCFLFIEFFFFQNIEYFFCCFFEGDFLQKNYPMGRISFFNSGVHSTLYTLHSTLYTTVYIMQYVYCC